MADITVRALESRDAEAFFALFDSPGVIAGTLQLPFPSVEGWRERLAQRSPERHRLAAELEGQVVGSLSLSVESNPRRRHCASVGMAVHDAFQGRGVGTALLAAAIDLADNWLDLRRLELTVFVDNAPAIHLYEKFGFVVEGTARQYAFRNGVYVDAHSMARLRDRQRT